MINIIKNLSKKEWIIIIISILLIFFEAFLDLKMPDYMSNITKLVQMQNTDIHAIIINGGYMLLCTIGSLSATVLTGYLFAYISASFSYRMREKVYDKVNSFGMEEIKKFRTSSLITRTTNDITNVEMFITMGVQMLLRAPITAVWAIIKIVNKNLTWTSLTGGILIILMVYVFSLIAIVIPRFKKIQKIIDNVNDVTRENLSGLKVVRAFNAEDYSIKKFEKVNKNLTDTQMFNQTVMGTIGPMMYLSMHALTLGIYFLGAIMISSVSIPEKINLFSEMVVFSMYSMQVIGAFIMLSMTFIFYPRASVSASRINEVLNTFARVVEGDSKGNNEAKGEVEFKNVSFKYPDGNEYVLKDISFKASPGEVVAFIGSTGSGKTTLVNLIPRFYDVTKGEVLVDGINVKDYKFKYLNNLLGYVPQKARMFMGSVKDNISYGESINKINDKDVDEAIKVSMSKEFVDKLEGKENFIIAQGGNNISGGQKQRLSIARAIARKPKIYIFDDTFSALDYKTDAKLRSELKKYTKGSTILIVASRIGTIMNADKIIVLDEGKCVGIGTHKELLENCEVYKEIALSQLSLEELA